MSREADELYNEGYGYYYGGNDYPLDYDKAFERFTGAANLGNSDAMNYLGVMYQNGRGVGRNTALAADWYYKAIRADNANAYAAYNLGNLYYTGDGVPRDMVKAFEL